MAEAVGDADRSWQRAIEDEDRVKLARRSFLKSKAIIAADGPQDASLCGQSQLRHAENLFVVAVAEMLEVGAHDGPSGPSIKKDEFSAASMLAPGESCRACNGENTTAFPPSCQCRTAAVADVTLV